MKDTQNILVTGGIPSGTWTKFLTWEDESVQVDPKIIEEMKNKLKGN